MSKKNLDTFTIKCTYPGVFIHSDDYTNPDLGTDIDVCTDLILCPDLIVRTDLIANLLIYTLVSTICA